MSMFKKLALCVAVFSGSTLGAMYFDNPVVWVIPWEYAPDDLERAENIYLTVQYHLDNLDKKNSKGEPVWRLFLQEVDEKLKSHTHGLVDMKFWEHRGEHAGLMILHDALDQLDLRGAGGDKHMFLQKLSDIFWQYKAEGKKLDANHRDDSQGYFENYLANLIFDHVRVAKGKNREQIDRFLSVVEFLAGRELINPDERLITLRNGDSRQKGIISFTEFIKSGFKADQIATQQKDDKFVSLQNEVASRVKKAQREFRATYGEPEHSLFSAPVPFQLSQELDDSPDDADEEDAIIVTDHPNFKYRKPGIVFTRGRIIRMAYGLFVTACAVAIPLIVWKVRENKRRKIEKVQH